MMQREASAGASGHGRILGYLHSYFDGSVYHRKDTIYENSDVLIGRNKEVCDLIPDDPTVSNQHLRVYSILYDQDEDSDIAPLVYAEDLSRNGTYWNGALIGRGNGGVLLSNGDNLRISPRLSLVYYGTDLPKSESLDHIQEQEKKVLPLSLAKTDELTREALPETTTGRQLACKIVDLRKLKEKHLDNVRNQTRTRHQSTFINEKLKKYLREAEILMNLSHPNIIALEKVYRTNNTIYILEDLITAGDLYSYIQYKGGKLLDIEAAVIIRQILKALEYLHDQNIVHRDLKPDNILITSLADGSRIVLSDFGSATITGASRQRMMTQIGTLEYTAPLVMRKKGYTKAVDMWALGGVAVALLAGASLFVDSEDEEYQANPDQAILKAAAECNLAGMDTGEKWQHVGERAKDFVRKLLVLDEVKRMTVEEALEHPWFTNESHRDEFEAVYQRAIRHWRPRPKKADMIENLDDTDPKTVISKRAGPARSSLSSSKRALVPIDPPYMPFHRRMNRLVSPRRDPTALPSIAEETETSRSTQSDATQSTKTASSFPTRPDAENEDMPQLDTLQLSDCVLQAPAKANKPYVTPNHKRSPLQEKAARIDLGRERLRWPAAPSEPLESKLGNHFKSVNRPDLKTVLLDSRSKNNRKRLASIDPEEEDELSLVTATPPKGKLARLSTPAGRIIGAPVVGDGPRKSKKRRVGSVYDFEDDGTYDEVGRSSSSWRTALDFGNKVSKRREERNQNAVPADLTDSIRTAT
ncbi:MAG: hypothetical protein M1830_003714 [Pleopsidium flavum]|nr:MAG: hypothetical protein M1830_003714 [Pleopsidium flavum]